MPSPQPISTSETRDCVMSPSPRKIVLLDTIGSMMMYFMLGAILCGLLTIYGLAQSEVYWLFIGLTIFQGALAFALARIHRRASKKEE